MGCSVLLSFDELGRVFLAPWYGARKWIVDRAEPKQIGKIAKRSCDIFGIEGEYIGNCECVEGR